MAEIPAAYTRFVAQERRAGRLAAAAPPTTTTTGTVLERFRIPTKEASRLSVDAARRAAGFFRPTKRAEAVWVEADSELAVGIAGVRLETGDGVIVVTIPVRCDQTGPVEVHVTFAVGEPGRPAGLYAATERRPRGPALIVDTWGDALVAFAWQVLLDLTTGLAGATGKDSRGNRLIPVELTATAEGIDIVPMARHRFMGSPGLKRTTR